MGFLDKIKGAVNAVTGNAAKVTIDYPKQALAGDEIVVKITAVSTGGELKSKGCFVDVMGQEQTHLSKTENGTKTEMHESKATYEHSFQIGEAFTLAANETKTWEGRVKLPAEAQPSYAGVHAKHIWQLRGRIEATGNDPDSGFVVLNVNKRN
ncbi:MAG: hypothetical protein IT381_20225 [Deltaproteobacteria bacterium]|nr:hypothetical protein [Deltaproteobacteria bacterium]